MKSLTIKNIAEAVNGTLYNGDAACEREAEGVVIDSRKARKDYVFVAIKGERADGHTFISQVFNKGAMAVIVEQIPDTDKPYIMVESTTKALADLAEFYRKALDIKVVGITGSVGKTSTKEFIASVLSEKYNVLKTAGNFNNEIGLPLTVFNVRSGHQAAVLEMGISDFGEMSRLSKIARPDICVITNIGICHLENLGTRDGILKAKTEIFNYAKKDCDIILNGDDDKLKTVQPPNDNEIIFYGMGEENQIHAENIQMKGIEGSECDIVTEQGTFHAVIAVPGKHMIYNAMAAAAVGVKLGLKINEIKDGIDKLTEVGGRLNIIKNNGITLIDDCYNANPVSVKSSLDVLEQENGRKIAVLGDMFELGEEKEKLHFEVGAYLSKKDIQSAVFIGTLSKNTYEGAKSTDYKGKLFYFEKMNDFLENTDKIIEKGDTVLVKASHSMHFEEIVEALQK